MVNDENKWKDGDDVIFPEKSIGECKKCGIKLYRIMHYYCQEGIKCPSGLGGLTTL